LCLLTPDGALLEAAEAVSAAEADKTLHIERTATPPRLDGELDDIVWQTAAKLTELYQIQPDAGDPGSERTEVSFAYDDDYLYVGARMWDPESPRGVPGPTLKQGAPLRDDDRFGIQLDPFNTRRTAYRFFTNVRGVRHDILINGAATNSDWSTIWRSAGKAHDGYWVAEIAVPFKSLPFDPDNDTWGLNVSRAMRRRGEISTWISRDRAWPAGIAGSLTGLHGMNQGKGLDISPGLTATTRNDRLGQHEFSTLVPTLDAYYRLTPTLNAALTVNTDFSGTTVDDRQVSFNRFGVFFPERRDFFLKDSEQFEFGRLGAVSDEAGNTALERANRENGRPFFSRRLGLSPRGTPVDIRYGGKLSGRIGSWNIGSLVIQQDDFQVPGGALLEPGLAMVTRVSRNVLEESAIGAIVTHGNTVANVDNTLVGADFTYRSSQFLGRRVLEGEAWLQQSRTEGLNGRDGAWGLGVSLPTQEGWRGALNVRELQENFNPALGYVNVAGIRQYALDTGYTAHPRSQRPYSWYAGVDVFRLDDLQGGELLSQQVKLRILEIADPLEDIGRVSYSRRRENVQQGFTLFSAGTRLITVPAGDYEFDEWSAEFVSGRGRLVTGGFTVNVGDFYDGRHAELVGDVGWRPSPHFSVTASGSWNRIELPGGTFISRVARLTTEVGFSPQLGWTTTVQYDNSSELLGLQSRVYWVPQAGQEFSLVLNHSLQDFDRDRRFAPANTELAARGMYTFRF
jgi:hypothetical protein